MLDTTKTMMPMMHTIPTTPAATNYDLQNVNAIQTEDVCVIFPHLRGLLSRSATYVVLHNKHDNNKMLYRLSPHFSDNLFMLCGDGFTHTLISVIKISRPEKISEDEFNAAFAILTTCLERNVAIFYTTDNYNVTDAVLQQIFKTVIAEHPITHIISLMTLLDYLQIKRLSKNLACVIVQCIRDSIYHHNHALANFNLEQDADGNDVLQYEIPYDVILMHIQPMLRVHEVELITQMKCFIVRDNESVTHFYNPAEDIPGYGHTYLPCADPHEPLCSYDMNNVTHVHYPTFCEDIVFPCNAEHFLYGNEHTTIKCHNFEPKKVYKMEHGDKNITIKYHNLTQVKIPNRAKSVGLYYNVAYRGQIKYWKNDDDADAINVDNNTDNDNVAINSCDRTKIICSNWMATAREPLDIDYDVANIYDVVNNRSNRVVSYRRFYNVLCTNFAQS